MDTNELVIWAIVGLLVNSIILYVIIKNASDISTRNKYAEMQIKLLSKIAKKLGVPEEEVKEVLGINK